MSSNESLDFLRDTIDSEQDCSFSDETEEADEKEACLFWGEDIPVDKGDKGSTVKLTGKDNNSAKALLLIAVSLLLLFVLLLLLKFIVIDVKLEILKKVLYFAS